MAQRWRVGACRAHITPVGAVWPFESRLVRPLCASPVRAPGLRILSASGLLRGRKRAVAVWGAERWRHARADAGRREIARLICVLRDVGCVRMAHVCVFV